MKKLGQISGLVLAAVVGAVGVIYYEEWVKQQEQRGRMFQGNPGWGR